MIHNPIQIEKKKIVNRVVLQPMEGCDCNTDGSPSQLTVEKYIKAARSGAGLIWFEANAVCPEGRTNPRQMMLTNENRSAFQGLLKEMREIAKKRMRNRSRLYSSIDSLRQTEHRSDDRLSPPDIRRKTSCNR